MQKWKTSFEVGLKTIDTKSKMENMDTETKRTLFWVIFDVSIFQANKMHCQVRMWRQRAVEVLLGEMEMCTGIFREWNIRLLKKYNRLGGWFLVSNWDLRYKVGPDREVVCVFLSLVHCWGTLHVSRVGRDFSRRVPKREKSMRELC